MAETNWAGNVTYGAARLHFPGSIDHVREIVARSRKVRVLGSRHSFNSIADTPEDMISLSRLPREIVVDAEKQTVMVDGGARYGDLCPILAEHNFALPNLASLPHISIAGACATATHGSGDRNGNLATAVRAIELVTADGSVMLISRERDGERFNGAVVNLGALGIVTKLTLDVIPSFNVRQDVFVDLSFTALDRFEEIVSAGYSVSLFTDWQAESFAQAWIKRQVEHGMSSAPLGPGWMGARAAEGPMHPISSMSAESCTEQMGVCGPWHERLTHFRLEHTPSAGEELQSEYFVPREHALPAFQAVHGLKGLLAPILQISEVRTIHSDALWMSPCYQQSCVALHFTWVRDWPAVGAVLPKLEEALAPFHARPHWGKLFTMGPGELKPLYPRLSDFRSLTRSLDPAGKFRNTFLDRCVFAEA